ncbi:ArsR/SmtB family transcription factor [Pseudonocardia sp.]
MARTTTGRRDLDLAEVLRALGDPTRLEIVCLLSDRVSRTTSEVAETIGLPASTCSYHLKQLRSAGVTACHIDGKNRYPILRIDELDVAFPGLVGLLVAEDRKPASDGEPAPA